MNRSPGMYALCIGLIFHALCNFRVGALIPIWEGEAH